MVRIVALSAMLCVLATPAFSQYPNKPVRLVVPFAPGDALDTTARVFGESLRVSLHQPVIVENRPGAAGSIAAEAVAKAAPDGYTLLWGTTAMLTVTPYLRQAPHDPNELEPIARLTEVALPIAVNHDLPVRTWNEFVDLARRNPGKYTFASSGEGTLLHLIGEQLQSVADIKLLHVPYKGMAPALTDYLSGQINVMLEPVVIPHVKAGKGKALAIIGNRRLAELPDVPTAKELGLNFDMKPWFGLFAPRGTPQEIVAQLNKASSAIADRQEFTDKMPPGVRSSYLSTAEFTRSIEVDRGTYKAIIQRLNIRLD